MALKARGKVVGKKPTRKIDPKKAFLDEPVRAVLPPQESLLSDRMLVPYKGRDCVVSTCLYGNRRLFLSLVDPVKDERVAVATTNFANADDYLNAGEFLVLNDQEEAGLLDLLQDAGIVSPTGRTLITPSGRLANICMRGLMYTGED